MDRDIFEGIGWSSEEMYIRSIADILKLSEIVDEEIAIYKGKNK
jgi:hypothetical protein